jgi:hypothetical protein
MFSMTTSDASEDTGQVNGMTSMRRVLHKGVKPKQLMAIKRAMRSRRGQMPMQRMAAAPTMQVLPKQAAPQPVFGTYSNLALASACGL